MKFVLTLSVCLALAAQSPATFQRPAAPGQLVDIGGGKRLHVLCKGSGDGPTVVVEAGLSQYTATSTYGKAQDAIASFARVCIYDRFGLGWSDAIPDGRTHRGMVEDLHKLVAAAGIQAPYVLVGHSMGGLLVRQYAQTYRSDVAGVILADATSETIYDAGSEEVRAGIVAQIDKRSRRARPTSPGATNRNNCRRSRRTVS
jgi:pimeloyl-ACP methyl ester carboxylesterase